ncbi:glutathione S-transferase N-terminal domain-containing protein [Asticcacaulis sp. EMRT-3]|uniref:glutathione S-transferase N-terminal domain-containing protein n=1 Tax=Asticcacaulis sp. EMRT-3 TaxID=3040349 RepID=UPI0024AFA0B7|nr:glutathione S-transferase N-terminal domain-containing protein [Asticcacaulis sp. EMRT-3]MDI7776237.1 glutathione S-transferase N-terminal domain-containing protein [Asticcacaulis sp. EMRT-3]
MKLFVNSASPFARKARIVVRECGWLARTEEVFTVALESPADLTRVNPVAQIPALADDDGVCWQDSALICAWLDAKGEGDAKLLPAPDSQAFWAVRRLEAAANGLIEMNVRMVLENRRPENERSPFWLKRWEDNLVRGFTALEAICPAPDVFDMGALTVAVAGTYTTFRYPHIDWRGLAPKVATLTDALEKRQSFIETYPK